MQTLSSVRVAPHNKTMGIEIECLLPWAQQLGVLFKFHGFFYAGEDGSIRTYDTDGVGIEFVSQPLTQEWMNREIKKLYKKFPSMFSNSSCGIHIHVSKKWVSPKKAEAIYQFLKTLDYGTFEEMFGRRPNEYCYVHRDHCNDSRYCAVSVAPTPTVEFRMFASGNCEWSLYCVKCVRYMIDNAYRLNIDAFLAFVDMEKPR